MGLSTRPLPVQCPGGHGSGPQGSFAGADPPGGEETGSFPGGRTLLRPSWPHFCLGGRAGQWLPTPLPGRFYFWALPPARHFHVSKPNPGLLASPFWKPEPITSSTPAPAMSGTLLSLSGPDSYPSCLDIFPGLCRSLSASTLSPMLPPPHSPWQGSCHPANPLRGSPLPG